MHNLVTLCDWRVEEVNHPPFSVFIGKALWRVHLEEIGIKFPVLLKDIIFSLTIIETTVCGMRDL